MVFLYDAAKDEENWEYSHWFPHVWSEDKKTRYVASNKSEASDVLFELTSILNFDKLNGELQEHFTRKLGKKDVVTLYASIKDKTETAISVSI